MVRKQFHTLFTLLLATTLVTALLVLCHYGVSNAASTDPTDDGQPYVVQPGDSLYKISGDFYGDPMAWSSIVEATNAKAAQDKSFATIANPSTLRVGQKLWLPKRANTTTARKSTTTTNPVKVVVPETTASTGTVAGSSTAIVSGVERVFFEEPQNGATVPPHFTVKMAATGLKVEPSGQIHAGAGHMHILVDTDFVPAGDVIINDAEHLHFGKGQLTTPITLTPGIHVLRLQFANGAHVALDGPQYQDTITVTVASTATGTTATQTGVHFVEPLNGATVPPNFTVKMAATGLKVEPSGQIHAGAGHMHILVDTDFVPAGDVIINDAEHLHFGKGQLTTPITLTPGIHVLRLQFANGAHVALDGPQYQDTITVTVASTATGTTATQTGVHFVEPLNGATVPPNFTVKMAATGLKVEPSGQIHAGAGHMHILVDTDFVPAGDVIINDAEHLHFGKGQLTTPITLTPGIHVLRLQFANGAHVALDGPQYQDTITVTVASTATGTTATQTGVHFVEPLNGATVPPNFTVKMAATGLKVEPSGQIHAGAGHMHILVDTDFVPAGDVIINDAEHLHFGKGQLTTPITLTPGIHVLRLQFANGAHVALDGPQYQDTITVTVASSATGTTATQTGVHFVEPLNGATVPPNFTVKMAATGLKVEPSGQIHAGAGHMHILVDTDFVPAGDVIINDAEHLHFGKGQLTTPITLTPGIHVLNLQFANGAHVALDGPQYRDTITVTVK